MSEFTQLNIGLDEIARRFERHVLPEPNSGCWLWTGYLTEKGYGRFNPQWKTSPLHAHRVSYELNKGPIPPGLVIDHLCRNPCCVNPDHLESVTQGENVRRGNAGINHRIKTHCTYGHPFSETNTRMAARPNGLRARVCRTCERMAGRRKYARKKQNDCR